MKKKKSIVSLSLLSLCLLASCSETSSSGPSTGTGTGNSSSTGGQVIEPADVTNLQRAGDMSLRVDLGEDNPIVSYNSPLTYSYQASDENIDTAAEIKLLPNEMTKDGEADIEAIKDNYNALGLIMSLVGEYAEQSSVNLASAYYNDMASKLTAENLRTEELTLDFIGDKVAFVNTSTLNDITSLRSYAETTLPQADMSMLTTLITLISSISEQASNDLIALLKTIDILLPDESTLRPILSIIGDAVDLIGNGISINLEGDPENDDIYYVSVYLNEDGVPLANELLGKLLGESASSLSLNDFTLDLTLQNSDTRNGLLTDLTLNLDLAFNTLSLPVQVDFNLGTDEKEISKTYFSDAKFALDDYATINTAVDSFYSPIKNYVQLPENSLITLIKMFGPLMGLDFEFGFMTTDVSLTSEVGETLKTASEQIDNLDNDVKFIIGDYITKDNIMTEYNKGLDIVKKAVSDYASASSPSISSSNVKIYFSSLVEYADWDIALSENNGADLLSSLGEYLDGVLTSADTSLTDLQNALSAETIAEKDVISKYGAFNEADKDVTNNVQYFYGDKSTELETYNENKSTVLEAVTQYQSSSINTKVSSLTDYASLQNLYSSEFYTTFFSDGSSNLLSADSASKVTSILEAEATSLKTDLLSAFKASADKESFSSALNTFKGDISALKNIEQSFLSTDEIYSDLNAFGTLLNDALPAA